MGTPMELNRVLIVDDNAVNRSILSEQMASWTFDSCAAESGAEGLKVLIAAAAYGVPLLAVFLATDPGLTGPVGSGPIVILGGKGAEPAFGEAIAAVESNGLLSVQV